MPYHCPYCDKISYEQHASGAPIGFAIMCAHCGGQFSSAADDTTDKAAEEHQATDCPIICPNCPITMRVTQQEYEALSDHMLACPACETSLRLPAMPPLAPLPSALGLALKLGVIYLLILASLGLLFTPQGAELITDLAQLSDRPSDHLAGFQKGWQNIWHRFLGYLQGLFV